MTLPKLVELLQSRHLFFTRVDKFSDRFEGTLPLHNARATWSSERSPELREEVHQRTLVNCWHLSRYESDALWQVYGRYDAPVAIRTTAQRLFDSFELAEHPVYVGLVHYIDFRAGGIAREYERFPFLFKRNSFQHEREVRAVIRVQNPPEFGRGVPVDVDNLIEQVYVPSYAPDWFMSVVTKLLRTYEVPRPVKRSRERPHEF